ncbi:hypothetical protein OHD62_06440 [Mesorhizobium sp. YC-39]|uniref:hypothetical protein n=1 Tax=unclassified Mesorhizobium TaxID=325217 RepID=UPI0021E7B141|nr:MULTISPECIES: hypothetical protein [unclassified Mesorhizobium]MCV3205595.1 hypothetical protein [Mesorhizobium sp. YC-2]MCV3228006.1 hypothetical protein [Mesorhizobium sp. YC-39]
MSGTDTTRHPFLDDLTSEAELTGTVLRKSVRGRENVRRVVEAVGKLYSSQTGTFLASVQGRTFVQYDAMLRNGLSLQAVAVIERNDDGSVPRVNVSMSPLASVLSLSAQLGTQIGQDLGGDHFL